MGGVVLNDDCSAFTDIIEQGFHFKTQSFFGVVRTYAQHDGIKSFKTFGRNRSGWERGDFVTHLLQRFRNNITGSGNVGDFFAGLFDIEFYSLCCCGAK